MSQTAAAVEQLVRFRLRQIWWRRLAGAFLEQFCFAILVAGTVLLLIGIYRFLRGGDLYRVNDVWGVLEVTLLGVIIWTLGSLPFLDDVTRWIDRRAGTHDRFHTALDFAARPRLTPLEELTLAECALYAERFPVARWTPLRLPCTLMALPVPLIALGMLAWHASLGSGQPSRDPALQVAVTKRAAVLQKMVERLRREDEKSPSSDLAKLADAMQHSAERLKESQRQGDEQKLKTSLAEMSSLEAMLNAMKQAAQESKVSPGELAALAAALESNPQGKDAAEAIKAGQLEQAGDQLAQLAEKLGKQGDVQQMLQQLAQSMQEQAAKLSATERNEVARQMQQAAQGASSGQPGLSQQALQRLADALRKAGKSGARQARAGGKGGQPLTEQQLQQLLNALENMKEGDQPGGDPGGDNSGGQQSLATVEAFGKGQDASRGGQPTGMPGGERDQGTNDHLFADKPSDLQAEGNARRLEGKLGDGATLQELVGAASGPAKASRQYRDLYEAITPAEQSSVEQENIPLGSRYLVRRYFENIRPQN